MFLKVPFIWLQFYKLTFISNDWISGTLVAQNNVKLAAHLLHTVMPGMIGSCLHHSWRTRSKKLQVAVRPTVTFDVVSCSPPLCQPRYHYRQNSDSKLTINGALKKKLRFLVWSLLSVGESIMPLKLHPCGLTFTWWGCYGLCLT